MGAWNDLNKIDVGNRALGVAPALQEGLSQQHTRCLEPHWKHQLLLNESESVGKR